MQTEFSGLFFIYFTCVKHMWRFIEPWTRSHIQLLKQSIRTNLEWCIFSEINENSKPNLVKCSIFIVSYSSLRSSKGASVELVVELAANRIAGKLSVSHLDSFEEPAYNGRCWGRFPEVWARCTSPTPKMVKATSHSHFWTFR